MDVEIVVVVRWVVEDVGKVSVSVYVTNVCLHTSHRAPAVQWDTAARAIPIVRTKPNTE